MSRKIDTIFEEFTKANIFSGKEFRNDVLIKESSAAKSIEPYRPPKKEFRKLIGKKGECKEDIGDHPDFTDLELNDYEYQYIVSVFLDIKGSTILGTKLPLKDVRFIKNGILVTAIDFFQVFDGHVHRLQGDAICAFFGSNGMKKSDAIIDALNATSFLQSYFEKQISNKFEEMGFPPIKIRIGLDFGDDNEVLWTRYGIKNTDEVTTTSIHTDLAAKLESKASANSTMIGENIVNYLDFPEEFYSIKKYTKNNVEKEDRYIMNSDEFLYKMWVFDWNKYLNKFAFLKKENQNHRYKSPNMFKVKCFYKTKSEDDYSNEYRSNCKALPKNIELKFELETNPQIKYDDVIWIVNNRGKEAAKSENELDFHMKDFRGENFCLQETKYTGHHYMKCILKSRGKTVGEEYFGIYVNDN